MKIKLLILATSLAGCFSAEKLMLTGNWSKDSTYHAESGTNNLFFVNKKGTSKMLFEAAGYDEIVTSFRFDDVIQNENTFS